MLHSTKKAPPTLDARDRRLILLFFDFSAMQPEEIDRSVDAAKKFVTTKLQPADLIAIVSLATNMHVDCDFTDDREKLSGVLAAYTSSQGQGFDNGPTGSSEGAAETGGSYTEDDTDLNTFTADRKLLAIQSLVQALGKLPQKKSIVYFSNGITQSGVDNQSALRAATAAAVKANTSDLFARCPRFAGLSSGRRSAKRQPAWAIRVFGRLRAERSKWKCRVAGYAGHAFRGHRRQGIFRFQRFQRRLFSGPER